VNRADGGRKMDKTKKTMLIAYSLLAVVFLYIIEQILMPGYIVKSISKVMIFFVGASLLQNAFGKRKSFFRIKGLVSLKKIGLLGLGAFSSVMAAYALLGSQMDAGSIIGEMESSLNINRGNFMAVGIYIILVNAAIEEYFFRGFLFLNLKNNSSGERLFAYIYSSLLFSIYHLSIFKTWFDAKLIAVAILGLLSAGFFFNYIDEKDDTIICSYIIHACGDAAIILIGLKMFELAQ